ncbi:MAG: TonB-dependent receptor [Gammaproteobacteria bacterium]|nr:TonB-dependent receptor [Gammaproteobacteria bacterium]
MQSDPTLVQFMTIRSGDNDLDSESARTYTAGIVLRPQQYPDFTASMDYYRIVNDDVVDANAQFLINENAYSGLYPLRVVRDSSGNIIRVLAPFQNIGSRSVSGVDFEMEHAFRLRRGARLALALKATHIATFEEEFEPGGRTLDYAGTFRDEASAGSGALPDWKLNLSAVWQHQLWNIGYHVRIVSSLAEVVPGEERRRTIDGWSVHRTQASYLGPWTLWTKVTVGIDNIWDEPPPFSAAAFNDSYDSRTYDLTGRYAFLHLAKHL